MLIDLLQAERGSAKKREIQGSLVKNGGSSLESPSIVVAGSIPAPVRYSGLFSITERCGEHRLNISSVLVLWFVIVADISR